MTTQLHIAVREGRKAVIPTEKPVVFSAGPIRNSRIWQNDAMRFAFERGENIFFASPLRDGEDGFAPSLLEHLAPFTGEEIFLVNELGNNITSTKQPNWGVCFSGSLRHYLVQLGSGRRSPTPKSPCSSLVAG